MGVQVGNKELTSATINTAGTDKSVSEIYVGDGAAGIKVWPEALPPPPTDVDLISDKGDPAEVAAGGQVLFTSSATGGDPSLVFTIEWFRGAGKIPGETAATYTHDAVAADNNVKFFAVYTDQFQRAFQTNQITMNVFGAITASITADPANATVPEGADIVFTCSTDAAADPITYDWLLDGVSIGAPNNNVYTRTTEAADSGKEISCKVTDSVSNTVTTDPIAMNIPAAPTVNLTPTSFSGDAGDMQTYNSNGQGYQLQPLVWKLSGAVISGEEALTYTRTFLASDNNKQIQVEVRDAFDRLATGNSTSNISITQEDPYDTYVQDTVGMVLFKLNDNRPDYIQYPADDPDQTGSLGLLLGEESTGVPLQNRSDYAYYNRFQPDGTVGHDGSNDFWRLRGGNFAVSQMAMAGGVTYDGDPFSAVFGGIGDFFAPQIRGSWLGITANAFPFSQNFIAYASSVNASGNSGLFGVRPPDNFYFVYSFDGRTTNGVGNLWVNGIQYGFTIPANMGSSQGSQNYFVQRLSNTATPAYRPNRFSYLAGVNIGPSVAAEMWNRWQQAQGFSLGAIDASELQLDEFNSGTWPEKPIPEGRQILNPPTWLVEYWNSGEPKPPPIPRPLIEWHSQVIMANNGQSYVIWNTDLEPVPATLSDMADNVVLVDGSFDFAAWRSSVGGF